MLGSVGLGEVVALVGMVVMLLTGMARRRVRQGRRPAGGGLGAWLVGRGDVVAFVLIVAGLVLMYLQKK
jgi:uncharacterized membrane protein